MHSIYKHTSPFGKIYIGITGLDPEKRWNHGFGYQNNQAFFKDIVEYGWSNFKHEIIATVEDRHEAARIENILIKSHDSTNPVKGYNLTCGDVAQCFVHSNTCTDTLPQKVDGRGKAQAQSVAQYSKTGTLIATYGSLKDASTLTGINQGDICSCCRGHKSDGTPKHTAGGYVWQYINKQKEVG